MITPLIQRYILQLGQVRTKNGHNKRLLKRTSFHIAPLLLAACDDLPLNFVRERIAFRDITHLIFFSSFSAQHIHGSDCAMHSIANVCKRFSDAIATVWEAVLIVSVDAADCVPTQQANAFG